MFTSGQDLAGRFQLIRPLSDGTTPVWLACELATRDNVVLKIFSDQRTAAEAEYNQLIALAHPQILQPLALLPADELTLLVMPPVGGGTLGNLRAQPYERFMYALLQVGRAVEWLHEQSLVHGDLKADNVLLDSDGNAKLIDFGNCLPLGTARQPNAAVSAYSVSPQQRAAQPAAFADDIYAFGALLYELLSGQPPGYATTALMPAVVHPAPEALLSLSTRCLAADPGQRPMSMAAVLSELEAVATSSGYSSRPPAVSAPLLTPPGMPLDALQPTWNRAAASRAAVDPQLRWQGFRRGFALTAVIALALVAVALFILPGMRPVPAPTPATAALPAAASAPESDPDRDLRALALQKSRAEELQLDLSARLAALKAQAADVWSPAKLATANAALLRAVELLKTRDYAAASSAFTALTDPVLQLERERPEALARYIQQGQAALTARDAAAASTAFSMALKIDPSNGPAQRGSRRAGVLDAVWVALGRGSMLEQQGNTSAAAAAYRVALRLDPDSGEASAGVSRTGARLANDEFGRALAQVFTAIDAHRADQARSALTRVRSLRPQDPAIAGAEAQVAALEAAGTLTGALTNARAAEANERWAEAVKRYRDALAVDATLVDGRNGLARSSERAQLDQELATLLAQPERVFSGAVFAAARESLRRAEAVSAAGPHLIEQRARVAELLRLADTPIQVPLESDSLTAVTINRVGDLGTFAERRVELRPGRYTVVGTRAGYRDVRRELNVLPNTPLPPLRVACEDPI